MPQKFFDIIPPKQNNPVRPKTLNRPARKEKEPQEPIKKEAVKPRRFSLRFFIFSFLGLLIIGGIVGLSVFSSSEIEIFPKIDSVALTESISIDIQNEQPDFAEGAIPGEIIELDKSSSQEFLASGVVKKEERAKGVIRVYNAYSTAPQPLVVGTRFVSAEGKLFKSLEREVVPGATNNKGKLSPAYIDIDVEAAEGGADYNIGPSTFSVPGFAGTPKYTAFYGKSLVAMAGGFEGDVPQVTQTDIDRARDILANATKADASALLRSQNEPAMVLSDKALSQEITAGGASVEAKAQAQSFVYSITIKSRWLVFSRKHAEEVAIKAVEENLPEGNKTRDGGMEISYNLDSPDLTAGRMAVNMDIRAEFYADLNLAEIKRALVGKSNKEAQLFLKDQPQIDEVKIKSWPIWVGNVAGDERRISIIVNTAK